MNPNQTKTQIACANQNSLMFKEFHVGVSDDIESQRVFNLLVLHQIAHKGYSRDFHKVNESYKNTIHAEEKLSQRKSEYYQRRKICRMEQCVSLIKWYLNC